MECLPFLIYVVVKAICYVSWCGLGATIHGHRDRINFKAFVYGFVRLVIGVILGAFAIANLSIWMSELIKNPVVVYAIAYLPVRWVEWSLMAVLMDQEHRTVPNFFFGLTWKSRLWRLGGMAISCLADLPLLIEFHGPFKGIRIC